MGIASLISYLLNIPPLISTLPWQQTEVQLCHLLGTIQHKETGSQLTKQ